MASLKLATIVLLLSTFAWADSQIRIVRLSLVDGPAQLDRATGEGFERAIMNMPIAQGMQLWTRDDSRAEVEFEEGNTIRLAPGTKIEFAELILRDDGSRATLIKIDGGRAYVNYSRKSGEDFRIQVGNHQVPLRDSVRFRADVVEGKAELAVLSGNLYANGEKLKKNNTELLDLGSGTIQFAKGVTPVLDDDWDKYRTDYHDQYAKSAYRGASYYGRSDLNYYGGWYSTNIGACWRPYGFDASWSPYSAGAWAYYPGYGYTFVSAYPWGWQPFRYGAWNYASGFGYCWTPGRHFYGYGYTPVVNPPRNWVPVQPPSNPTSPTTITGGPGPYHRGRSDGGLIPVGDVDTSTWRARHHPGDGPWNSGDRWTRRGDQMPGIATGGAGSASVVPAAPRTASSPNPVGATVVREKGRIVNPDADAGSMRDMQRQQQREWQREMRQQQHEMQRTEMQRTGQHTGMSRGGANRGGFDRGGVAPASSPAAAPSMSPPSPPPQMSAPPPPPPAPVSRGETRHNVPK